MITNTEYLFEASEPQVEAVYSTLIEKIKPFGLMTIEPKKTSIHITNKSAFLGVHPKKKWIDLNIVTAEPINSERVMKTEQISKNRYHNLVRVSEEKEIDTKLISWLKQAYELKA